MTTSSVAVLLLAGVGTATVFSGWRALAVRTVDVAAPETLAIITMHNERGQQVVMMPDVQQAVLGHGREVFEAAAAYVTPGPMSVEIGGLAQPRLVEAASHDYFAVLAIEAARGRFFGGDPGSESTDDAVAVAGYAWWSARMRDGDDIVGQVIRVAGVPVTVVGVVPHMMRTLNAEQAADLVVPLTLMPRLTGSTAQPAGQIVGRLRPGVSLATAGSVMSAQWEHVGADKHEIRVTSGAQGISALRERYEPALRTLLALGVVLLLTAVLNVGSILLVNTASRCDEFATCLAVGATPRHIATVLAIEALTLSTVASMGVLPLAYWCANVLSAELWSGSMPLALSMAPDRVASAAILAGGISCGLLAAMPSIAWWVVRAPKVPGSGKRTVSGASSMATRLFVTVQVALTVALVFVGLLAGRSMMRLGVIDPGYSTSNVMWTRLVEAPGRPGRGHYGPYVRAMLDELAQSAGVEGAAVSFVFPSASLARVVRSPVVTYGATTESPVEMAVRDYVSAGFFDVAGVRVLRGRGVTWEDDESTEAVAVISAGLERRLFEGEDGIGRLIQLGAVTSDPAVRVVGIAEDASPGDIRLVGSPVVYTPALQAPATLSIPNLLVKVRPGRGEEDVIRTTVERRGWHQVWVVRSIEDQIARSMASERVLSQISAFASVVALLIASVGIYASASQNVLRRYREFGTRLALGATPRKLFADVIRQEARGAVGGVVIGLPFAVWAAARVSDVLYEGSWSDAMWLCVASTIVVVVGAVGVAIPTYRGVRVEPGCVLRAE